MKTTYTALILAIFSIVACEKNPTELERKREEGLIIIVNDISKSTDQFLHFSEAHIYDILNGLGDKGGGKVYALLIKSNSNNQEALRVTVPDKNIIKNAGANRIMKAKIQKRNEEVILDFENEILKSSEMLCENLIRAKSENFTDIDGALQLVNLILDQYDKGNARVLILSDMINDLPGGKRIDPITVGINNSNAELLFVRPGNMVDLDTLFPSNNIRRFSSIDDAIEVINN